jgi:glyoxalase/bleomycin resistance protein/dioxygenase superfamily protein
LLPTKEDVMKERRQPETLRLRAVMPALTVNDIQASLAWYRDVLGFVVAEEYSWDEKVGSTSPFRPAWAIEESGRRRP